VSIRERDLTGFFERIRRVSQEEEEEEEEEPRCK
jgi:hypothetical protein